MKIKAGKSLGYCAIIILALCLILSGMLAGCASKRDADGANFSNTPPLPESVTSSSLNGTAPSFSGPEPAVKAMPKIGRLFRSESRLRSSSFNLALPLGAEELWVIARGDTADGQYAEGSPGSGSLFAKVEGKQIQMPLKHTSIKGAVIGYIAEVEVQQQFENPYNSKIEAVYVFPLPANAAVNEFIMVIGERRIRGIIRERKEAEEIYNEAKRQGHVASLLTEERPNVFTQSVANIEPGKQIDVNIKYFNTLAYVDGWYEFVFPLVVGPRFNPPGTVDGIGAVARGHHGASSQAKEVHYLKPGEDTGHRVSLKLDIDAGVAIEEFRCKTHEIMTERPTAEQLAVRLSPTDALPNRDFVLRYRVAGDRIKSSLVTHRDERGGFFSLMLYPPKEVETLPRRPVELVFVIDCSGSMNGRPIAQAKAAVQRGLRLLQRGDSFQLVTFSMSASQLGQQPLEANSENIQRALQYLNSLKGEGGTMMIEGIKAALDFPHDPQRMRFVCFLTDGYIGNEAEILGAIHKRLGPSRIFSFGIGSSVNRHLIEHMAKAGRGAVAYLGLQDEAAQVMADFFERISHPALTDLAIDWGGLEISEVYPRQLPDLFVGRPVLLSGRLTAQRNATVRITGRVGDERLQIELPVEAHDRSTHKGLPSVWARMKIGDLADESTRAANPELPDQMKQVALDYGLLSAFTAFVAVDSTRITEGAEGTTVPVAVPVPEGVKYETTVSEK